MTDRYIGFESFTMREKINKCLLGFMLQCSLFGLIEQYTNISLIARTGVLWDKGIQDGRYSFRFGWKKENG